MHTRIQTSDKPLVYADVKTVRDGLILANKIRKLTVVATQGVIGNFLRSLVKAPAFAKGGTVPPISPMDKSYDDLATNTSYSIGSYGMITNTTTIIQPVVQEV